MAGENPFDDIPGTVLFDAAQCRAGFQLNQFCMSLMKADNRAGFKADERAYLDRWSMTEDQKQAVLKRDWTRMIELGGNIYFTLKLAATDGTPFPAVFASMGGVTAPEYLDMMLKGGRAVDGVRSKNEAP
jgi:protocatechuate 4,5-dioxygenase alpha chain